MISLLRVYSCRISIVIAIFNIVVETHIVGAVVALQSCSQGDTRGKEENGIEGVQDDQDDGVARPVRVKGCRDKIKEGEHGECGGEHGIVHRRGVAGEGLANHVTDESHDQQSPYELTGISLAY